MPDAAARRRRDGSSDAPAVADAAQPPSMPCMHRCPPGRRPRAAAGAGRPQLLRDAQPPRRRAAATAASPASSIVHEAGSGTAASGAVAAPIRSLLAIASE